MASPYKVQIKPDFTGLWKSHQDESAASKATSLLQSDLEQHHVFFNPQGFHDHLVHQILTLYSTGAGADVLQKAYDGNVTYQAKAMKPRDSVVAELHDDWDANASKYLGLGKHYSEFLKFFQTQIDKHGWQAVVQEFLCSDTPKSIDLCNRLYAGLIHPMIQLLYGLEFEQPAIIAQGLAQTAVHKDRFSKLFAQIEAAAEATDRSGQPRPPQKPLTEICESLHSSHPKLATSSRWDDSDSIFDGVMARAGDEAIALCAQIRVTPDELEERTAEMLHNAAYIAAGASLHPPHVPKYDFFFVHLLNSAPFFLCLNKLAWVPDKVKVRLLENKMRFDLIIMIAYGCPRLDAAAIKRYAPPPADREASTPPEVFPHMWDLDDDGHLIKASRALALAQEASRNWNGRPWVRLDDDAAWLNAQHLLLASARAKPGIFVRLSGFDEAWANVPKVSEEARL